MSTKRAVPDYGLPIVTPDGKQTQEFNDAVDDMIHAIPLIGTGTPEGVVEARQGQFYIDDTNLPVLYAKQLSSIDGDKSQGWVASSSTVPDSVSAYWTGNSTSTAAGTNTWTPIAGTLVEASNSGNFTVSGNSIIWDGEETTSFLLVLSLSYEDEDQSSNSFDIGYTINAVISPVIMSFESQDTRFVSAAPSINTIITLDNDDIIIPNVRVTTATGVVVPTLNISLTPIG